MDDDFSSLFNQGSATQVDAILELMDSANFNTKTDLYQKQAIEEFKIRVIDALMNEKDSRTALKIVIDEFQLYKQNIVSLDGKRANSILETLKEMKPELPQPQGLMP